jgi:hypothetical protein
MGAMKNRQAEPPEADDELFLPPAPGGIHLPKNPVRHRNSEYEEDNFTQLLRMQQDHFWYSGRHRFIAHALREQTRRRKGERNGLRAIDLGGGCADGSHTSININRASSPSWPWPTPRWKR